MKRINILFIFIFSVPSATFSQQSDLLVRPIYKFLLELYILFYFL